MESSSNTAAAPPTLLYNARIYTFDAADSVSDAILLDKGVVVATGPATELRRLARGSVCEADLGGATVLPGMIDTHPHLLHFGSLEEPLVKIWDASSHEDIARRIMERADVVAPGEWIMTTPVGEPHFFYRRSFRDLPEGCLPTRDVLDRASDRHPVVIQAWAPVIPNTMALNSMALAKLGIDRNTPDQVGTVAIEKDKNGEPTGRLHGSINNYYSYNDFSHAIWSKIPFLQYDSLLPGTKRAISQFHAMGITGIYENHMMDKRLIDVYRELRKLNQLQMRVVTSQESEALGMPWSRPRSPEDFMARMENAAAAVQTSDPFFRFNGLSVVWDGLCAAGHLMMRRPYKGPNGNPTCGEYQMAPQKIELAMKFCAQHRLRLNTMAVGIKAHDENLAMLERIAADYDIKSLHWVLVHGAFIESEQAKRYKALNMDMTTSMIFCYGKGDLYRERLGQEAMKDLMPLRRYFDAGMAVSASTDWGPKSAFEQIQLALTHEFGRSGYRNLGPDQKITRLEAVSMWTRDASRVLDWPEIGTLRPRSYADLVVVDRDPITCPIEEIGSIKPMLTLFDGRVVHDSGVLNTQPLLKAED
ncbi:amidohydrolase [Tardiphaga robiniae]|uniref:Amidohydrolase family protein n=1 Tax=Tardiphaga robiniae TaxID=943830 RepID=A0A7G6U1K0_9BRAD|nr:amidohydrolase family protein [Tardiphaga robiniae]QND72882.1 amidohydrolase family protein [Tardiphaga robiniae]